MKYVLGTQFGHDGSVSLVRDRKLVGFIATERLTREKKQRGITKQSIKYVLDKEGIKLKDVELVTVNNWFWDRDKNGKELFDKEEEGFNITVDNGVKYSQQDYYQFFQNQLQVAQGLYTFHIGDQIVPCMLLDHHFSHCASSFYLSPYDRAIALSVDFSDNVGTGYSIYYFNDEENMYRPIRRGGDFNLGSFYGQICDFLGFYPSLTDAGKVMALAAYEEPDRKLCEDLIWGKCSHDSLLKGDIYAHLLFRMGVTKFPDIRAYYPQLRGEGGVKDQYWLNKKDCDSPLSKKIAANAQYILEQSMIELIKSIEKEFKNVTNNICMAGGTILNCVSNGILSNMFPHLNFFVPPACGDDGLSIGSALFVSNSIYKNRKGEIKQYENDQKRRKVIHTNLECIEGGVRYSLEECTKAVEKYKNEISEYIMYQDENDLNLKLTRLLDDGKIVGYFKRGSEIGPRALCHRSILADPRRKDMKDILNDKVKHREGFRPFAPVILEDNASYYFGIKHPSPFMLFSVDVLQDSIPSATHIDKTSRLQTVDKDSAIWQLLNLWYEETDCPVLINTSFNVAGEPIVETPEDAMKCFLNTEIDVLVLENWLVIK